MPIDDLIGGVWDEQGGDDVGASGGENPSSDGAPEAGGTSGAGGVPAEEPIDEVGGAVDWSAVPDDLKPLAEQFRKQLQADYTRKTQAVAEQRKLFGDVDPVEIQDWVRLKRLASEDPASVAEWLERAAAQMRGQDATAEPGDTDTGLFDNWYPQTEGERLLAERLQQMEERQKQFGQFYEQQVQAQVVAQIDGEFAALERKLGRELSEPERDAVADFCTHNQIRSVEVGWKALNYEAEVQRAIQQGVDRGSAVVMQKATAAPVPAGTVARPGVGGENVKGLDAITRAVTAEIGWE